MNPTNSLSFSMKVCIFTGTRAEYGLLQPLIQELKRLDTVELRLLVSGTHLSPEFGYTIGQIEEQELIERVEMLLSSDSAVGLATSFGLGAIGMAPALNRIRPDVVVIAGDRYEALACACVCTMLSVPVAHLHGGETSGGSLDEHYRHAITKLSQMHFTSTEPYRQRVIQMGEHPDTVFNVGAVGLDNLRTLKLLDRAALETSLGIRLQKQNLLITYHSEFGLSFTETRDVMEEIFGALDRLPETLVIFTRANADENGRLINAELENYVRRRPETAVLFDSLGSLRYFSLLGLVDAVVGNSSSGLIEAPSLGTPTVNLGHRQDGRIRAPSVLDCEVRDLLPTLQRVLSPEFQAARPSASNPYGDGHTAERIARLLTTKPPVRHIKKFYDSEDVQ